MREVVEQILTNKYDYEKGTLDFSCAKVEMEIAQGEVWEGSFSIYAPEGKYTKGYVSATDVRMECLTTEFVGSEAQIQFCFHGEQMSEGEVLRGEFHIVSNQGEYILPYVVTVMYTVPDSSVGPIKNLFHFANLAKSSWQEAVKMFYSDVFKKVLQGGDEQVYLTYLGLAARPGNEQCVEEFLIVNNKKQKIEYIPSKKALVLKASHEVTEEKITILKNGWGYTYLEVITEGEFLFTEKSVITEDDFLGNYFNLPVYIDSSKLHAGRNWGKVVLKSTYGTLCVPVEVARTISGKNKEKEQARKKYIVKLMGFYDKFRLKKMNSATWIKETIRIIDKMVAIDERDAATRLFQAQMLITCDRFNEAGWILEHVGDLIENEPTPAMEAYYLYLNTLLKKDEYYTRDITEKVMRIYREHGEDWRVAWLMLFMSGEYNRGPVERWGFLEKQYINGCRSPLIYVEAMQQLVANPTLLRKLGDFELQVLHYGSKRGMISLEILDQLLYLSEKVKEFSNVLYCILTECYTKKADVRVLKEICTLLIKGNKIGQKYFSWYEKGVTQELRIINIYEYFMLSMEIKEEPVIPKQALLYFAYQNNLDYERSAYLYYYVAKRQYQAPEIFDSYRKRIEFFVAEQLQKKHINIHLAFLYHGFIKEELLTVPMAEALAQVLYCHEIRIEKTGIRNVIVRCAGMEQEQIYPVMSDKVAVPLFGMGEVLLFEDVQGNRFIKNIQHSRTKLMVPDRFVPMISHLVSENVLFDMYLYEKSKTEAEVGAEELQRQLRMLEQESVGIQTKRELVLHILHYYYEAEQRQLLEEFLDTVSGEWLTDKERGEVVRYLTLCERYNEAYEWLVKYSVSCVDEKILMHLLERKMELANFAYEKAALDYTYDLFTKGKCNSSLVRYMMLHYNGMLRNLREIWKESKHYDMESKDFCERIILQNLFSGMYVAELTEIFKEYVYIGPDMQVEEAYLRKNSYEYFVNDLIISQELLTEIGRLYKAGAETADVCQLAYLKYYADNQQEIQVVEQELIRDYLNAVLKKGICLKCMVDLRRFCGQELFLADKTVIEYRATDDGLVQLHYLIMKENDENGEYITECMQQVIGKVYYKEFVLFNGESLQYYVTEEVDGKEKLTESATCPRGEESGGESAGKYSLINDIILSKNMRDNGTFSTLVDEYYKKDFYNKVFFSLKD